MGTTTIAAHAAPAPDHAADAAPAAHAEQAPGRERRAVPAWLMSLAVHGLLLLLLAVVVVVAEQLEEDAPPVRMTAIEVPPPTEPEEPRERTLEDVELTLEVETESDVPTPITEIEVPVEDATTSEEEESEVDAVKGREEAIADSEAGGQGAFMAIGAGGGASGIMGGRTNAGGKKRALARGGGSRASEDAVLAALRWFKRHQSPNGLWEMQGYEKNCQEAPKCEPGRFQIEIAGGHAQADIAFTAYAVLCYLGAGHDHRVAGPFKRTVKLGLEALLARQAADGRFAGDAYGTAYVQGAAAMALAEAYAMTNDPALKEPAQRAIDAIKRWQTRDDPAWPRDGDEPEGASSGGGLGWGYQGPSPEWNDVSISGWMIMALKSGKAAGLDVGDCLLGARNWLVRTWRIANPKWRELRDPYKDRSVYPYGLIPRAGTINMGGTDGGGEYGDLAAAGALCAVFLGHGQGDIMLESLCNWVVANQVPTSYPCYTYRLYYATLALFQAGGPRWEKWNAPVRDMLVGAQRVGSGCLDGSWDPGDKTYFAQAGRLMSTAYCCLSLEVYYRYLPAAVTQGREKAKGRAR